MSYLDSQSDLPPLHFYQANGFPISVYLPLLESLSSRFRVMGLGLRGQDAQTEGSLSWYHLADDLIDFLNRNQPGPVVGVGHSAGAVATMFAAVRRPELFSKIVLLDPVLLPWKYIAAMLLIRLIGRKNLFFLAKRARSRRNGWEDHQAAYAYFQSKPLFERFEDVFLRSYVTYGLKASDDGGVELLCPPEAEARVFENYPLDIWRWPGRVRLPVLIIRGVHSDVLTREAVERFLKKNSLASATHLENAGHLAPMEASNSIRQLITDFAAAK